MRLPWLVPPQPFLGLLLRRAVVLWLLGRLMVVVYAVLLAGSPIAPLETVCLGLPTSLGLTGLVAGLTVLDVRRRHEVILLANLGGSLRGIFLLAALPSLVLEALTCFLPL